MNLVEKQAIRFASFAEVKSFVSFQRIALTLPPCSTLLLRINKIRFGQCFVVWTARGSRLNYRYNFSDGHVEGCQITDTICTRNFPHYTLLCNSTNVLLKHTPVHVVHTAN